MPKVLPGLERGKRAPRDGPCDEAMVATDPPLDPLALGLSGAWPAKHRPLLDARRPRASSEPARPPRVIVVRRARHGPKDVLSEAYAMIESRLARGALARARMRDSSAQRRQPACAATHPPPVGHLVARDAAAEEPTRTKAPVVS